ncbi:MAG: hypothetical protein AAGH81_01730 [Bacteroidota bacterium]
MEMMAKEINASHELITCYSTFTQRWTMPSPFEKDSTARLAYQNRIAPKFNEKEPYLPPSQRYIVFIGIIKVTV